MPDEIARGLNTLLPLELHTELTEFAKKHTKDANGKWSYTPAFRLLLERAKAFETINQQLLELQNRVKKLEGDLDGEQVRKV